MKFKKNRNKKALKYLRFNGLKQEQDENNYLKKKLYINNC